MIRKSVKRFSEKIIAGKPSSVCARGPQSASQLDWPGTFQRHSKLPSAQACREPSAILATASGDLAARTATPMPPPTIKATNAIPNSFQVRVIAMPPPANIAGSTNLRVGREARP
jgi:hypothetical protein